LLLAHAPWTETRIEGRYSKHSVLFLWKDVTDYLTTDHGHFIFMQRKWAFGVFSAMPIAVCFTENLSNH